MSLGSILLLAVGLSMDATAVAAARGLAAPVVRARNAVGLALCFGAAQAGMPVLGWLLGSKFGPLVSAWDHWVAFLLLAFIGSRMLFESLSGPAQPKRAQADPFAWRLVLVLAIATSIDAFAAGITLPMLGAPLLLSVALIGGITALFSWLGVYAGRRFGDKLGRRLDVFGGIVLILLGVKVLLAHLAE